MGKLTDILDAGQRQMTLDDLLATIEREENPVKGDCPHIAHCRNHHWRALPQYRPGYRCHWMDWGDWLRCRRYKKLNGGAK